MSDANLDAGTGDTEIPEGAVLTGDRGDWIPPSATKRLELLRRTTSVAMVGASSRESRPSYFVATYLLASTDFDVYFVNPRGGEVLGHQMYPSLAALPVVPDMVDVFRRSDGLPEVLDEAIDVGASSIWVQLGLWHDEVAARGHDAGMDVVMNRCLKIEHARFAGGLHLAGFDTGVISSRRRPR